MASPRRGPARTGTVEPFRRADGSTYYRARVRLGDGSRVRVDVPEKYSTPAGGKTARERAELYAEARQEREDETGELLAEKRAREKRKPTAEDETADEWFERYLPTKECGESHRRISGKNWEKWVSPVFGAKPMRLISRDDVEDVRDRLDAAIDGKVLRHSTARNIWSTLTSALKAAHAARDRKLRVLEQPLGFVVLPPKRGAARQRPWIYPSEWTRLAGCAAVSLEARRLYAIALYTGLRPGELRVLEWGDVDFVARVLHVSKAFDEETGETKAPKTEAGRRVVPVHEHLLPLLENLRGAQSARVVSSVAKMDERLAGRFREHLATASVSRARLTADSTTEEPADFRSLRDTCATWLALAGVSPKVIQRRLGHKSADTTDRYIKAAESFGVEAIGAPFPPLPPDLIGQPERRPAPPSTATRAAPALGPATGPSASRTPGKLVARVGFESMHDACFAKNREDSTSTESVRDDVSCRTTVGAGPDDRRWPDAGGATERGEELPREGLSMPRGRAIADGATTGGRATDREVLEAAIAALTRALATADDAEIAAVVGERAALRAELRALDERAAGVVPLRPRRQERS